MSRKENNKTTTQYYNQEILREIRSVVANNPNKNFLEILFDLNIIHSYDNFDPSEDIYNRLILS